MLEPSLIMLQALRTTSLLKRRFNAGFFPWFSWIIQKHLSCVEGLWTAGSETPERLFKSTFFTEHLQWLLSTVLGFQPATLLKKRHQQRRFSVNFAKFLRTSFDRTPPDDSFLCLSANLEKLFRSPLRNLYTTYLGNCLFHVQDAEF